MKSNKGLDYSFLQQIPEGIKYAVIPFLPTHPEVDMSRRDVEKVTCLQLSHFGSQPGAFAQTSLCQHLTPVSQRVGAAVATHSSQVPLPWAR